MLPRIDAIPVPGLGRLDFRAIAPAVWRSFTSRCRDPLRHLAAESAFLAGEFDRAIARFRGVTRDPVLGPRARLMEDWIRFHRDDVSVGWPRYPGTDYQEPVAGRATTAMRGVRVADPRRPGELATHLGMRRWTGTDSLDGPLLVWFNFRDSLGGEILASRLIRLFQRRHPVPLFLGCGSRLVTLFRESFPECEVIDNSGPVDGLAGRCQRYVLARDRLGLVVGRPEDFAGPAAERLRVPAAALGSLPGSAHRPQVAFSWKTTNDHQGRYRNVPVANLARVLARHDCDWHVAQHGPVADDLAVLRRSVAKDCLHTDTLHPAADMATFAGELAGLDAVITVDNSLLHLAGGLGIPTLGLLTIPAYWAWPAEGPGSRWYDSVRLLRQQQPGDWGSVLSQLGAALGELMTRRSCSEGGSEGSPDPQAA